LFYTWQNTSFNERKKITQNGADLMRERSDELATIITLEIGKRIEESKRDVQLRFKELK
jgi:succinate-semialdehyde dehydrogenase/glutarate-semialdehyde dehydrogenase